LTVVSLRKLGRYDIVRVLGKGAMGIVYEGRDPNLDRPVAIKTVKVENLAPEAAAEYEARFRTEARSAARLQHPNIVSVYDSDRHGDVAYLVMEYIQGDDLKHHLDSGERYSLEKSLHIIDDLLSALDYAHRHGIVHRDIKPANLLLAASGRVKLTDFGVARMQDGEATRTQGAMIGTLKYMSPEQVQGQKVDTRADLFSVGVLLYQLLTDRRPFDGDNEFAIIHQIVGHTPPPPSSIDARLPAAIDGVVARALAKQPQDRFATAAEFASALRAAVSHAEDATIVPPANPARAHPPFQSATSPGTSPMGNSTVTQELELVYWKDVKDSTDPEDLEVFLAKFPTGIYAELARRRLRKLAAGAGFDQAGLSDTIPIGAPIGVPAAEGAVATGATDSGQRLEVEAWPEEDTLTLPQRGPDTSPPAPVDLTIPLAPEDRPAADETTVPITTAAPAPAGKPAAAVPRRMSPAVLAGTAAVFVAGLTALLMIRPGGSETPPADAAVAPASAASVPAARPPTPIPSTEHVVAPAPAVVRPVANNASHARALATRPRHRPLKAPLTAAAASASAAAVPAAGSTGASPAPAPPAAVGRDQVRAAAAVSVRAPATSPADVCKGKVFLSLELCLAEQCGKPGARNDPVCVNYREEKRLREESRFRD